jgi:hypothetical protein
LPFLRLDGARFALFTPTGGVLFAARILEDLAGLLTRRGIALHDHTPVVEITRPTPRSAPPTGPSIAPMPW